MQKLPPIEYSRVAARKCKVLLAAFTLVEVTLAIGLTMYSALVIFAVMPHGLYALQDSGRQIVENEIFNTIDAELSSTPYTQLSNYQTTRFPIYCDNEGSKVDSQAGASFIVRCDAPVQESGGELSRVTIKIGYNQDPETASASAKISKRSFLVANKDSLP